MHPARDSLIAALAAVGFTSTVGQLLLLRELVAVFYGNELVLGLILAAWLAWVAVGAWGSSRKAEQAWGAFRSLTFGLVLAAALLPAQVALVRASHTLLGVTPGALVAFGPMVLIIVLVLAPLCLLLGRQFTLGARLLAGAGGSVGNAYAAESVGALAGGASFSFLLVGTLDPFQIALALGALNLAVAAFMLRHTSSKTRGLAALAAGAAVLLMAALPLGGWLQRTTLGWQYTGLRFARDSIYGRIVVTGSGEQRAFFENGLLFFETQGVAAEEVAHLPLLAHPQPRRVLLIGGGVSGVLAESLRHPSVQAIYYVELDPLLVAAARAELPPDQAAALDDPRVTLAHVDGRLFVRQWQGQPPFDVVILDLPEPATGQLNRFYTQEFFAEVRHILAPGGILALSLPWQENYPGPALQQLAASVYRTLATAFPQIAPLSNVTGERLFLLASDAPLPTDPATFIARRTERGIETRWVIPSYLDYLLTTGRVSQARRLLETATGTRLNRDLEPISYLYDLTVWLTRFYGGLSRAAAQASLLRLGWLAVPLAAAALLLRRWPVPAAIGLTGLAGMTLEVVMLFAFQVVHGYVYGQVGLLVTAFMAGLALGSGLASRWRWPGEPAAQRRPWHPRHSPRVAFIWIQGAITLFALGFLLSVFLKPPAWTFLLLAMVAGGLTGLAYPVAAACLEAEKGKPGRVAHRPMLDGTAGLLYGADLVGGCVGAALASGLMVPVLGIPQTCLTVALVGLAGVIVLL
jgi:spermidine synthase